MHKNRPINNRFSDVTGRQFSFNDFKAYYDFIKREANYWAKQKDSLSGNRNQNIHPYLNFHASMSAVISTIENWNNADELDNQTFQQHLNQIQSNQFRNIGNQWLWSGHDYVPRFVEIHSDISKDAAESFLSYVSRNQAASFGNKDSFDGALLGYEYVYQNSDLVKRRKSERATITQLRDQLQHTNNEIITEVEETKLDFNTWFDSSKLQQKEWQHETQNKCSRLLKANSWIAQKKGQRFSKELDTQLEAWQQRIDELEQTFKEKLRLEKPAEYWKASASKLRSQGIMFTTLLLLTIAFGVYGLADFFKIWLLRGEQPINLASVQGVVLFGSIAAVYAFIIKVLSRLTFSSFHLMRDAEEREQLTYLYLSLTEGSDVDKESREIVLQALFSRSETGLLAQEQGPAMPGASEIMRAFSKGKS
ncbi:hypothetical protein J3369_21945 [Alteromonas sp. NFXS44]|uniref:DUF6161 domain-containing protein n=1 Tax=Alteromonas sp. NFXS44 TaxID=2818435 RepID=UPI0032DE6C99